MEIPCKNCGGSGQEISWEHAPYCDGSCKYCPVQGVSPCEYCGGSGIIEVMDES